MIHYLVAFILLFFIPISLHANHPEIRFGVFAYLGKEETTQKYQPLADYLSKTTGKKIILEVLTQEEMNTKISRNELDIITTNPTHFLVLRQQYAFSGAIATLVGYSKGVATSKLGGVIVVRADSPIHSILALKDKKIATPSTKHMGGYRAQAYEFYKQGINLQSKQSNIIETKGSHQEVVHAVLNHKADAGFIRDGILEEMITNGEITTTDIRVINAQNTTHPYIISTRLYPEWPVCALPHLDDDDLKLIASALFSIKPTNKELLDAGIYGYTMPADYLEVEQLARELRLPPFDQTPDISYRDIWENYKNNILIILTILVFGALYYARVQNQKRLFETLLSNIGDGIYGIDQKGKCIWINDHALQMIGYTRKEVIGKDQHALFHHHKISGEVYDEEECPITLTLRDQKTRRIEDYFIQKNGTIFPVSITVANMNYHGAIVVFKDMSEQRKAEKMLQENEERFRLLIDNMHSGVAVYTPTEEGDDFIFQNINPSVTRIDKVTYEEAIGKKVSELFPAAREMGVLDAFRRVYDSGISEHFPSSFYDDGKLAGWRNNFIYKLPSGEIVAIYDDVTDQKNLEIKLQMTQFTIDNAQVPFYWSYPESGDIFYVNQAACEILGYTFDELTQMNIFQIDPNFDAEQWRLHNQLLKSTPFSRFETEHKRRDETIFDVEIFSNRVDFNGEVFNSAFAIDISKRKYYEKALRKNEMSLRKAQSIAHIGNWELDIKSNRLEWSNEIFRIFEIDPLSFEASYEAFVHGIHPDDRQSVHDAYTQSLKMHTKYTIDHRLLMEDGRIKWVREIGDTEYDAQGIPLISRGTVQDITEQIQVRFELEKAKTDLEEANQSLVIKNYQLKELAMIDGLTKIANRRLFDETYEKKYRETLRSKKSLSILMIDVDNFKAYNDHYGHAAGDDCLIEVATSLKLSLKRPTDIVARYGGEEFVVLLKDIDLKGAKKVANTLLEHIRALNIVHEYSNAANCVTVSIGLSFKEAKDFIPKEELLKQADDALYRAKENGRNQIFLADHE